MPEAGAGVSVAREIEVRLGERAYTIKIGRGTLGQVGSLIATLTSGFERLGPLVLVTNQVVARLYGPTVRKSLAEVGADRVHVVEIRDGEGYKTLSTVETVYDAALDAGVDRSSIIVALGGGVVGDVAGFAAATLLRGLRLVMVPTTLLAQVDSSVGGKTGVNRPHGKNLVGAFHQPSLVIADPDALRTLPDREYRSGLAEVVKYAVILDAALFDTLELRAGEVAKRDADVMTDVIARCTELKAGVVEQDETEGGLRRILNFGHTIGHALEQVTDYRRYLHGEAVAIGMVAATRLSERLGSCGRGTATRLESLLRRMGLQTELPRDLDREQLMRAVAIDKKAVRERIAFIVCTGMGSCGEKQLSVPEIVAAL